MKVAQLKAAQGKGALKTLRRVLAELTKGELGLRLQIWATDAKVQRRHAVGTNCRCENVSGAEGRSARQKIAGLSAGRRISEVNELQNAITNPVVAAGTEGARTM